jgi:protein-S-isoprenylcysteine O-methyltransferase Ste14
VLVVAERPGLTAHAVELFARFRVALGFLCGVAVFWLAAPTRSSIAAGLPVAMAGEGIRIWAAGHLNKSREVTRSGPYRFVAHPLYLGSSVIGVGLAIASHSLPVAAIIAAYLTITLTAAIRSEEAFLRRIFRDAYEEYRHTGIVDRERPFSLSRALANREYRAVAGAAVALLLLVWKATYNGVF